MKNKRSKLTINNYMKKILVSAFALYLVACGSFMLFESDDLYAFNTTVQDQITITQVVGGDISITSPANVTMSPELGGIAGGTSDGFGVWTIICSDNDGFTAGLTATSTGTDASGYVMKGNYEGDWIENYTEGTYGVPDYAWSVSNAAEFGYTATTTTAADLAQAFKSNGSSPCNTGSTMANDTCWIAASSTSRNLITRTSETLSGVSLSVHFRVQINGHVVTDDTYVATTTITATVQ